MQCIKELQKLQTKDIYPIEKIEWWLLKYNSLYKDLHSQVYNSDWYILKNNIEARLPNSDKTASKFILEIYEALEEICNYHRNEEYFKNELEFYYNHTLTSYQRKRWIEKNEFLGTEKYVCFLLDYLDYCENPENLLVYTDSSRNLEVYIDRIYFTNTLEFLDIFNSIYWK